MANSRDNSKAVRLGRRPDELIYQSCYSNRDLHALLSTADERSRIRRLPAVQLYYGALELEQDEIQHLLPHITEDQWRGMLDLDLWSADRLSTGRLLFWGQHLAGAPDAVAKKLLRGTDSELVQLLLAREVRIFRKVEDDIEGAPDPAREHFETPDQHYVIELPSHPDKSLLIRKFVERLYSLDPQAGALLIEESLFRTSMEIEEEAYRQRRRRLEDLGFQDYFDAIGLYTPLEMEDRLPLKTWHHLENISVLPIPPGIRGGDRRLLIQALAELASQTDISPTLEEVFYVCNKLLSADRVSPSQPNQVRRSIRKVLATVNLGLDIWAEGHLGRAVEGLKTHYLQSFFQLGYGRLLRMRKGAASRLKLPAVEPGSFEEAALHALQSRFPKVAVLRNGKIRLRFFWTRRDLQRMGSWLEELDKKPSDTDDKHRP